MTLIRKIWIYKFVTVGLGLVFLGIIVGSTTQYTFVAGIIFVVIIMLGVIGIMKMWKNM